MSLGLPITRDTRRRDLIAADGQTVFTLDVPVFDLADVAVYNLHPATEQLFTQLTTGFTLSFVSAQPGPVQATFAVAPKPTGGDPAVTIRIEGHRVAERTSNATRNGVVQSVALEADLDKNATVLQELRRDVDGNLADLLADLAGVVLGQIPDGTLTYAKLAASALATTAILLAGTSTNTLMSVAQALTFAQMQYADAPSLAFAQAFSFAPARQAVRVGGFSAGGTFAYKRVATQPTHSLKFRAADRYLPNGSIDNANGGWFAYAEPVVDIRAGGADDAATDNTTAIQACIDAQLGAVWTPPRSYKIASSISMRNGAALAGLGSAGAASSDYTNYPGMSRWVFTGTGLTACITQAALGSPLLHASIQNLTIEAFTAATYSWILDFEDLIGCTISGVSAYQVDNNAGGVLRSRRIAGGDPNWINRVFDCEFGAPAASTAYVMDVSWTDSQFWGVNFDGGKGAIYRGDGNTSFTGCQFNRAKSGSAGLTVSKETASGTYVMLTGCAFDANVTTGLTLDATSSPSGSTMAVTVSGCNFRNPGGTQDILCVDGPLALSGISVSSSKFTDATVPTGVTFNAAKWTINFGGDNYYASGWKEPSQTFTPSISFGGAAVGVTYTTQTGWYRKDGNRVTFLAVITLSAKGSSVGAVIISGLPIAAAQQTPVVVGTNSNFAGLTGALNAQISGGGIILNQQGATGTTSVADTNCTNTTALRISGSYLIA